MVKPVAAKIDDIKRPGKTAPSATSRPMLVSSAPTVPVDPMLSTSEPSEKPTSEAPESPETTASNHTAKTLKPLDGSLQPTSVQDALPESKVPDPPQEEEAPAPDNSASLNLTTKRDPDAATAAADVAAEEAKAAREQELEGIIASGKYVVPVNALQRRRSHMHVVLLSLLAVVLLAALADLVFDIGLLKAPSGLPHTHLF